MTDEEYKSRYAAFLEQIYDYTGEAYVCADDLTKEARALAHEVMDNHREDFDAFQTLLRNAIEKCGGYPAAKGLLGVQAAMIAYEAAMRHPVQHYNLNAEPEPMRPTNAPMPTLTSYTDAQLDAMFEELQKRGYIAAEADVKMWRYIFNGGCLPRHHSRIVWIKKQANPATGLGVIQPNKKSLIDLLVMMGVPPMIIKDNVNKFFLDERRIKFKVRYVRYYSQHRWVEPPESSCHRELQEIIKQATQA